jgi:hypothetical protein
VRNEPRHVAEMPSRHCLDQLATDVQVHDGRFDLRRSDLANERDSDRVGMPVDRDRPAATVRLTSTPAWERTNCFGSLNSTGRSAWNLAAGVSMPRD